MLLSYVLGISGFRLHIQNLKFQILSLVRTLIMLSALIWIPVLGAALIGFWPGSLNLSRS